MKNRRTFLLTSVSCFVAVALIVAPVIADELLGVLTKVDIEGKKVTVVEKESEKDVEITITDKTELVTKKGTNPVDLEKLSGFLEKVQGKGAKGIQVKIEHEKNVASKIHVTAKKKAAPKNEN